MALSALVRSYDQLILDLDGCVWVGEELTPRAAEAVDALRTGGKRLAFVTNNSREAGEDYVAKLWRFGIKASLGDVVTVGGAMQHLLAETRTGLTAFVLGEEPMFRHVEDAGLKIMNGTDLASRAEVVLVSGTDTLSFDDIKNAALAVRRGAHFLATSRDPTYPTGEGLLPGTGAIVAAVETAAGRQATTVGKPEPQLFLTALERLSEAAELPGANTLSVESETKTLVVGDRADADLAAAQRIGLDAALVLTGELTREQAAALADPEPVAVADSLADLVLGPA